MGYKTYDSLGTYNILKFLIIVKKRNRIRKKKSLYLRRTKRDGKRRV